MLDSPILIISRLLVSGFKTQTSTTPAPVGIDASSSPCTGTRHNNRSTKNVK